VSGARRCFEPPAGAAFVLLSARVFLNTCAASHEAFRVHDCAGVAGNLRLRGRESSSHNCQKSRKCKWVACVDLPRLLVDDN
jgi:hypothetical protein